MTDEPKIWVALITAGFALVGTLFVAIFDYIGRKKQDDFNAEKELKLAKFNREKDDELEAFKAETNKTLKKLDSDLQKERDQRKEEQETEKIVSKFRDPLIHATYDLQSRIFNILEQSFLKNFFTEGSDREKEYSVENTVFLVAQFLGWTELVRQEIQFIDLKSDEETQKLRSLQDELYSQFQTDRCGKGFRLFAGEQRAVGELMINREGALLRCIGFAEFFKNRNPDIDYWLDSLREDVKKMANDIEPFKKRLNNIQHALIDLLEFLDQNYIYFPANKRKKCKPA